MLHECPHARVHMHAAGHDGARAEKDTGLRVTDNPSVALGRLKSGQEGGVDRSADCRSTDPALPDGRQNVGRT